MTRTPDTALNPEAPAVAGVVTPGSASGGNAPPIELSVLASTPDVAIAVFTGPDGLQFSGSAKRHPDDAPDERIGCTVAIARAARALAAHYEGTARQLIAEADARETSRMETARREKFRAPDPVAAMRGALEHALGALEHAEKGGTVDPHAVGRARSVLARVSPSLRLPSNPGPFGLLSRVIGFDATPSGYVLVTAPVDGNGVVRLAAKAIDAVPVPTPS